MVSTISMQDMRHLNLFEKITKIRTRYCFTYNDTLMFCVTRNKISKAIGKDNENLKKISGIIKKRIKIVPLPKGIEDAKSFIEAIVSPVAFKEISINDKEIVVTAGSVQVKASLLGRQKKRLEEMKKVVRGFFNRDYLVI